MINNLNTKTLLLSILEKNRINHKIEIIKETCLKDAHIYCKVNNLCGQITGPLIEQYIENKYKMLKNNKSSCVGDLQHNSTNYEIKVSNGGKTNNCFNFVQLRMNHRCEYLLSAFYLNKDNIESLGELFVFRLNKDNIKSLIELYGGYAHGTKNKLGAITRKELDNEENDKEYALRPRYNNKCWKSLLQFRIDEVNI
jgi:hypothetical protein